jgi:hypothetical protein
MSAGERVILAGIDEAGLGPLLGSLAIGYVILEAPAAAREPWKLLRGTVAKTPGARARVIVADSKLVFQRTPAGAQRLETTVLAFLAQRTDAGGLRLPCPRSGAEFLFGAVAPASIYRDLPWREHLPGIPSECTADSLELTGALLGRALARTALRVHDAGVRVVPAAELNASYDETRNKADSVWSKVLDVLRHVWGARVRAPLHATVDMLGGRRRYGSQLARAFPEASVALVAETPGRSAYTLDARDGSGSMALEFRVKADRRCFEVALASCFAKYARELEMRALNAYFTRLQPGLVPTAGYRGDGSRWLGDAALALERSGLARECLVRAR